MNAPPKLPTVLQIGTLLSGILGRPVTVVKSTPLDMTPKVPKVYGIYREAATNRVCICVFDLVLAANAGGAMLLFPPFAASSAVRSGKLEPDLLETIREVLNICSRFFHETARVVLSEVCCDLKDVPADAAQVMKTPMLRMDVDADIKGYDEGRLALFIGKPVEGQG